MNRLVIIGNGFDLAHGLPTSYKNFIDDYWKKACNTNGGKKIEHIDDFVKINCELRGRYNLTIDNINSYKELKQFRERNREDISGNFEIGFKNSFFKKICENSIENWVDIENEYYRDLKRIVKLASSSKEKKKQTIILNQEFDQVKALLEKYLKDNVLNSFQLGNFKDPKGEIFKFSNVIKPISIFSNEDKILEEFSKEDHAEITSQLNKEKLGMTETKLFFLNFNYTPTLYRYLHNGKYNEKVETSINFIHGEIGNIIENKINFGFGDEMDDDYKTIENLDDNEYLKNFKSFQYLQNSNYKQLLDFVESDQKFQVYIMGHSCGLSDRTMLNTIFEHPNCRSIKVFYHQREDGTDNYTEIIQNISRHFNKKKLMREKIVNKTLCQPLPQIQLPKK
ncbi:AbiH family protein [Flavobacterium sp. HJJ]|uniref:AbiH family protein n=1 Tax=Flavobacterium sp. HJJ TaxID=2783792 RepID=UPI00188BD854|nr:AbiH family protein [Flavobacterium sp. HJJ]MBF4470790.1 hypothetical protein [Flavobacterium sp. HJJ]